MEINEAKEIVAMLIGAYSNWKPTSETMALYVQVLTPLPTEAAREAVMEIIRSDREFAPPVGVLFQAATRAALTASGKAPITGEEAWGRVEEAIHYLGFYRGPGDFGGNAVIKRAVDAIGWENLCTDENVIATRAQFIRIFDAYQARELTNATRQISQGTVPERIEDGRKL